MRFNNIDIRSGYDHALTEIMRSESAHIIDMYLRLLKFYENDNCRKLNISCNENIKYPYLPSTRNGYVSLQMPFCLDRFRSLSPKEKSLFYLDLIHQSILFIGKRWGWNLPYFDYIRSRIISSHFKNQWTYGKPCQSPTESKCAYLRVIQTIDKASISLIITQNRKVIQKKEIIKTEPASWAYRRYLGEIQWTSDACLKVYGKEGQIIFEASGL